MRGSVSMQFSSAPSIARSYARLILAHKPSFATGPMDRIDATLESVRIDAQHLARFRRVCEVPESEWLPITYPHVLATPLHLAMFAAPAFPMSPFGIVHISNRIEQHRPLRPQESGAIHAWLEGYRETARGQELDLQTQMCIGPEVVWSETATFLARVRGRPRRAAAAVPVNRETPQPASSCSTPVKPAARRLSETPSGAVTTRTLSAHATVGRRYAQVSGDFNPIHLHDLAARLFGFRSSIAHGMWSLARCAAELDAALFARPCVIEVAFKRPIAFRDTMVLESWMDEGRVAFALRDSPAGRGHLLGSIVNCN